MHCSLTGVWGANGRVRGGEGRPPALAARLHRGDQGPLQSVRHCWGVSAPERSAEEQCSEKHSFKTFFARQALHQLRISSRVCLFVKERWRQWRPQHAAIGVPTPCRHSWHCDNQCPQKRGPCGSWWDVQLCWSLESTFIWGGGYRRRSVKVSRVQKNRWHEYCRKSEENPHGRSAWVWLAYC